jgi:flagellar motor switch protein FliN/FliY
MVDEILSQEEIDKLLNVPGLGPNGGVELTAKELGSVTGVVSPVFKAIGSTLGTITARKVKTSGGNKGVMVAPADIDTVASVLLRAPFSSGFIGQLFFYLPLATATSISDLALGGEGESKTSLDDSDEKALEEAFSHLLADAAPAITAATNVEVDFDALSVEALGQGDLTAAIAGGGGGGGGGGDEVYACKATLKIASIPDATLYILFTAPMAANIVYTLTPFKAAKRGTASTPSKSATPPTSYDSSTSPPPTAQAAPAAATPDELRNIELIMELEVEVMIRLGSAEMPLKDIQKLRPGSIIDLDRDTEALVELVVNGCVIAHGELVVTSSDNFALRVTEIQTPKERIRSLGS